jgi:hypothetical protein
MALPPLILAGRFPCEALYPFGRSRHVSVAENVTYIAAMKRRCLHRSGLLSARRDDAPRLFGEMVSPSATRRRLRRARLRRMPLRCPGARLLRAALWRDILRP